MPDLVLPLGPVSNPLPPAPFTPRAAAELGISRGCLDRLRRAGRVRRVLRGVYVDDDLPDSPALRAEALRQVLPAGRVVVGRSAAWLHGLDDAAPESVESVAERGGGRTLVARDLTVVSALRVTTPLRTALDLGRRPPPTAALAVLDRALRAGLVSHHELMAELSRFTGQAGAGQLRRLVAMADGRAASPADSVLRLRWYSARLPTPIPRLGVGGAVLVLGLATQRFGAVFSDDQAVAELAVLSARGWRVVVLDRERVLGSDPEVLEHHLEREFHRHLLDQVS